MRVKITPCYGVILTLPRVMVRVKITLKTELEKWCQNNSVFGVKLTLFNSSPFGEELIYPH